MEKETIKRWILLWTLGVVGGILFWLLVLLRVVKIKGYQREKLLPCKGGLVVIYRHPSAKEPVLLPFLFFPWFLLELRYLPFSTPADYFYQQWWYAPLRPVSLEIPRYKLREGEKALKKIKDLLNQGRIILFAPGGTREYKARHFKVIRKGKIKKVKLTPLMDYDILNARYRGKTLNRFKPGIGWLLKNTQARILPIWVETKGIKIYLIIGEPLKIPRVPRYSRQEIVEKLEDNMLRLGEKGC